MAWLPSVAEELTDTYWGPILAGLCLMVALMAAATVLAFVS